MQLKTYFVQYRNPNNFRIEKSKNIEADGILAAMAIACEDAKSIGLEVAQIQERKK